MNGFYWLLGLYAVAGTGISVAVMRKNRSQSEYFVGGGAIGWIVSAMTYAATTYSAFMMVGLVGLSYDTGVGALIFEMVYLVATVILLAVYGGRIWGIARDHGIVSPMELFAVYYGKPAATAGAVVAAVALIPYTAVQVIGLAVILEGYGLPFSSGVLFAVVVIGLWALLGGLRGVAITDAIQGVFMVAVSIAALLWVRDSYGAVELSTFPNQVWTPAFFVNLTLPWSFFALTNPQVMQRLFILKRKADLRKMIILFAAFGTIFTVIVTVVGFGAKAGTLQGLLPEIAGRDTVIVELMARMGQALALPLALSIVFASVSTANSILLTLSSMFTRDVFRHRSGTSAGRIIIIGLTAVVGLFALTRPTTLVELSVASSRILMVFLPLLFGVFYLKRTGPRSALFSLIGGGVAAIALGRIIPAHSSIATLLAATALFTVGYALDRRNNASEAAAR
ncbi:MAG TPA: sodium:solute symporter family protein [Alkalispirochaeta sp.]|nr:sodium:solute symporter family protein [Alkalispirochaeta sp.]